MRKGIDISYHNGNINFEKVKAAGIDFVIIRCGYGDDVSSQDDTKFHTNMQGAIASGLEVGIYLYSYAKSSIQAESEARHTLRLIKPYKDYIKEPIWYDLEESTQGPVASSMLKIYANYMNANGYEVGIYSGLSHYLKYLSGCKNYPLWIAAYGRDDGNPHTKPNVGECIWQYTSKGKVNGINGYVDMNYDYREVKADMTETKVEQICNDMLEPIRKELKKMQRFDELPEWSVKTVRKLLDKGYLVGTDKGLSLTNSELRVLVINDRAGLYD